MIRPARWVSTYLENLVYTGRHSSQCPLCLAPAQAGRLCLACLRALPRMGFTCRTCALPLPFDAKACGRCQQNMPAFDRVVTACPYTFPVDTMIGRFKFQGQQAMARPLIALLGNDLKQCSDPKPDILLPCPMHPARYRARGFNQAAIIAYELGRALQIPVDYQLCRRSAATRPQIRLDRKARLQNLAGVFVVNGRPPPHVAIVDDVVTTGATAQQLAKTLKAEGARTVSVWALARTPLR